MIWYDLLEESQCQEQQFDSPPRYVSRISFLISAVYVGNRALAFKALLGSSASLILLDATCVALSSTIVALR